MIALFVLQSVIYAKSIRKSRKVNRKICYSKQGKTALIIAGGPSSGFLDIDQVISEQSNGDLDVFAMNWYTNTKLANLVVPNFYVLSDPLNMPGSKALYRGRKCQEIWDQIDEWAGIYLIVPNFWYDRMQNSNYKVSCYIDERELVGFSKSTSICKPRGYCSMTAYKAIAAAEYLGYEKIYLIGFDSSTFKSTLIDSENRTFESSNNLADDSKTPNVNLNAQFPAGMSDLLHAYAQVFLDAKRCFKNQRILNIQSDSYLDAFPKVETKYFKWH